MIAQFLLSFLLLVILGYAGTQWRRSRFVSALAVLAAVAGLYFVWDPNEAAQLAQWAGVGRGVDLILYVWVVISFILMLNLHLKMRAQAGVITSLARAMALGRVAQPMPDEKTNPSN